MNNSGYEAWMKEGTSATSISSIMFNSRYEIQAYFNELKARYNLISDALAVTEIQEEFVRADMAYSRIMQSGTRITGGVSMIRSKYDRINIAEGHHKELKNTIKETSNNKLLLLL
jgi:hypothetical protein